MQIHNNIVIVIIYTAQMTNNEVKLDELSLSCVLNSLKWSFFNN